MDSLFNCCILRLHMLATSKLKVHNSVIHFFNLWAFHYFCLFIFVCLHFVLFCFQLGFLNVYIALLSWMDMPRGFLRVEVLALTIQWYSVEGPLKHVFSFPTPPQPPNTPFSPRRSLFRLWLWLWLNLYQGVLIVMAKYEN